ncbi:Nucleoside-diphosphate-sugar pyrophosphorylase involved in lipopolysaccharide biosynthesis/translation initiation factor 2B, gamma/epsilon subunits (eIF-2Bgamma/eIF-2Bepsilon) [hydrothermal vent metagenome]|uniref:Nucleoside-diphosphate-sugar pyrophosphorylase involved in lipopolysaccharide biosynthesis/translation initiation factor 2B, gamma/epsilon subunits (eIF-2Bgamma/eIF-2Bepsilon) n=1 Tax=hydrothermal vent metagenome TaxID=652676 RepID=A0A3B0WRM5_9ZZZZ
MINIVIPMAGAGSRFVEAGYTTPKPFIDVLGKPMISKVMDNLDVPGARFYLIARKDHLLQEAVLVSALSREYDATFIEIDHLTEGTACTVLYARQFINNDEPLLIANSDQLVDIKLSDLVNDCQQRSLDGSIMTFIEPSGDTKWSYARIDENEIVQEVREKEAISEYATVGIYLYSKGRYFVNAAIDMIINRETINNEYYTCPTYNYLVKENLKVGIYNIEYTEMHGLGTPDDLNKFLENDTVIKTEKV